MIGYITNPKILIMIYLLIFYWIFAGLVCFGAYYKEAKLEGYRFSVFICCMLIGGILFPMLLGLYIDSK